MSTTKDFYLINGRFNAPDAQYLMSELANAKIRYHHRRISLVESTEEDIKASESRIKHIEESLRESLKMLRDAAANGKKVDMEGTISIRIID